MIRIAAPASKSSESRSPPRLFACGVRAVGVGHSFAELPRDGFFPWNLVGPFVPSAASGVGHCAAAEGSTRSPLLPLWFGPPFVGSVARGVGQFFANVSKLGRTGPTRPAAPPMFVPDLEAAGVGQFLTAASVSVVPECLVVFSRSEDAPHPLARESVAVAVGHNFCSHSATAFGS